MATFNSWNVVDNYNSTLKALDETNVNDYFQKEILAKSKVNFSENESTADEIYQLDKKISRTIKSVNVNKFWMTFMRIFGGLLFFVGILLIVIGATSESSNTLAFILGGVGGLIVGALIFGFSWSVKKKKNMFEDILKETQAIHEQKYQDAQKQLEDLYAHLNDRMTFDIFEKTFSNIKFDDFLTNANSQKWIKFLPNSENISTIFAISGEVGNNPFIVWRTRNMEMYMEVYTGSVTVMVRRTRTVNNKTESYMAPKIIIATTTNPAPRYWTETKLVYLTSVIKDVSFNNMAAFKNERKAIKFFNKNKKMSAMENPEFDKMFPCERDNEVGYRAIWTPMAQEEMVKLLHLKNDYSFTKIDELNTIDSLSFNNNDLYYFANRYYKHFDHRKIKEDFIDFNTNFFIGVYFMFAPLLTIPIYQQTRYYDIASKKGDQGHSHLSLESKINLSLDKNLYFHHDSKTENILKAQRVSLKNNIETDIITSYGFQTRFRVVIITVIDFEAGAVPVPVTVIDYIPVSKQTTIETKMKENESDLKKQEINFAIASAILASSMPKEFKPDKEALLKTKPKKDTKK